MQHTSTPVRTWPNWLLICFVSLWVSTSAVAQISNFTTAQIEEGQGCNWPFSALATRPSDGKIFGFWRKGADVGTTYKLIQFDGSSWSTVSTFAPTGSTNSTNLVPDFDSGSDDVDLAIDALGRFHVVFRGSRGGGLTSTRGVWYGLSTNGTSWTFSEIQTFTDPSGFKGTNDPVIELDAANQPHIAFIISDANSPRTYGIRYYRYTGSAWVGETAITQTGGVPANEVNNFDMAIDGAGNAHLVIQRETNNLGRNGGLVYTSNSSGSWATPTVLDEGAQDQTQGNTLGIDTDAANNVHIVYSGYPDNRINYINNTAGSFSAGTQINGNLSGSIVDGSFRISSNGAKSFGYNSSGLRFAYQPGGTGNWITALAYAAPAEARARNYPSAILAPSGRIMLLFDNLTTGNGDCGDNNTRKLWYATATVTNVPTQVAPTVTTNSAGNITGTSATLGGNVTADGGASVTGRGVVYSSSNTTPAIGSSGVTQKANGSGTGAFAETITALAAGTTYYARAYATNSAGTSYGSVVTFTTTPNAPVVVTPANGALLNSTTPTYSGIAQGNATVTVYVDGTSIGTTTANGSGNFSLTQPTALAQGSHTVRATATVGSSAASASSNTNTYTVDTVVPTVSSVSAPANNIYRIGQPLTVTVNFSENVTVTGTPQLNLTIGSTTRQASYVSGSGTQALVFRYTIQSGDLDADGITLAPALSLNGGTLRDLAGNNATLTLSGLPTTTGVLVDGVMPTVSSIVRQSPTGIITNAATLQFRVSFSENVSGLTVGAFTLASTGTISGTVGSVIAVNGSGSQFDVTVNNVSGNGTLRLDVTGSGTSITDMAGNALSGGFTSGESFTVDQTSPVVVISSSAGAPGGSNRNSPIPFSVTFSESVTGFVAGDITVTNGTLSPVTGSGTTYNFTVTPLANGTVTVRIPANVAQDMAGNGNTAASAFSIDYLPLTLTGFAALSPSVCTESPLSFMATVSNTDGPYAYTLTNGPSSVTGTATGTAFSRTIIAAGSGPQSFTLVIADASQTVRASQSVTVNPLPVVAITGLASAYCQDATPVTLTGTPVGVGGSFTIDGANASILNPISLTVGQHMVAFRFIDGNGCSNATSQNVTIKETPLAPNLLTQSGQSYPASQSAVTVDLNTGTVTLVASGCAGTVNWTGPNNTAGSGTTIMVPTIQAGLFTYQANCTIDGCTGPLATATVRVGGRLTVLHRDVDNYADNNAIQPLIQVQNQGAGSLPLSRLTLRYYVTVENAATLGNLSMNYAQVGNQNVRLRYVALNPVQQGAQGYIEYSFTDGAGSLGAGANSGPIQSYFTKSDYGPLNELDDYSYNPVRNQLTGNLRITAYYDGVLISGQEPGAPFSPIRTVRALTESKNGPSATQINTFLDVRNEGNVAINYSDLKVRYYFTADGNERLQVEVDEGNVSTQLVALSPSLTGADHYLELSFNQGGQLAPGASTGTIRYRISKPDGGRFNQANDYSYQEQPQDRSQNSRVVVFAGQDRVWGQEPGAAGRAAFAESISEISVTVLGNPVRDDQVVFEVSGANGQPLQLRLLTPQGRVVNQQQVAGPQTAGQHRLPLGSQSGNVLLLQVSTPTQSQTVKVLRAE